MFVEDYKHRMRAEKNVSSEDDLSDKASQALEKERPYLMPGSGKTRDRNEKDMVVFLFRHMDMSKNGKVSMQEFASSWPTFMPKYFTLSGHSAGSKACTIL
jgi:hypothetical protein